MLLSFGNAMMANTKANSTKFFTDIGFTPIFISESYDTGSTESTVHYVIAKKVIDDFTVYSVVVKGTKYGPEWSNNLKLGTSGDHQGFSESATKVYDTLLSLIGSNTNFKIWVTGYSRGAAITNVLSHKLLKSTEITVKNENLYAYTFATPRGLTKENAEKYPNVFNLINSGDIVPRFAPEEYGIERCGIDIDINNNKVGELLSEFSNELIIPEFTPIKGVYSTETEYTQFIMSQLIEDGESSSDPEETVSDVHTREHYSVLEEDVTYFVGKLLYVEYLGDTLKEKFGGMSYTDMALLMSDNGVRLCNAFKEIFDNEGIAYDEAKLLKACAALSPVALHYLNLIMSIIQNNNVVRMINLHMTESMYVLLKQVEYK